MTYLTDDNETQIAFAKHFDSELELYKSMILVNLVEQYGKEEIIFDAYGNHVLINHKLFLETQKFEILSIQ